MFSFTLKFEIRLFKCWFLHRSLLRKPYGHVLANQQYMYFKIIKLRFTYPEPMSLLQLQVSLCPKRLMGFHWWLFLTFIVSMPQSRAFKILCFHIFYTKWNIVIQIFKLLKLFSLHHYFTSLLLLCFCATIPLVKPNSSSKSHLDYNSC